MVDYRRDVSEEEVAKLNLPAIGSGRALAGRSFQSPYQEPPSGREGRRLQREASSALYRAQQEANKTEAINASCIRIGVRAFDLAEQSSYAIATILVRRKRPEAIQSYLTELASTLMGQLGDQLMANSDAFHEKVSRELR